MIKSETFSIRNMTKGKLPSLPFKRMKEEIVGKSHEVSLVFIGARRSQILNRTHRGKDIPANILTFPLSSTDGEIFISPTEAKKDAPKFDRTYREFLADLFIHGLFHLKGDTHGSRMKKHEASMRRKFRSP